MFYGSDSVILNVALTGMVPTKRDNPNLPVTPEEIADDVVRCADLGATVFHLHARDESGRPTHEAQRYREIIDAIRSRTSEPLIVCVSTSGRQINRFETRSEVLDLAPEVPIDMASLTVGSLNFPTGASVTDPEMIAALATAMRDRSIVPELEVFDTGMIHYADYLIRKGVLRRPLYYNILLGSLGTAPAEPRILLQMIEQLPADAVWAATGIGRFQFPVNCLALALGGHVRVGLEDAIYMDWESRKLASNAALVGRLVQVARSLGREPASAADARRTLGIGNRHLADAVSHDPF